MKRRRTTISGRYEQPRRGSSAVPFAFTALAAAAIAGAVIYSQQGGAAPAHDDSPSSAVPDGRPPRPEARERPPSFPSPPAAAPLKGEESLPGISDEEAAEALAKRRLRRVPPAAIEAGGDYMKGIYEGLKREALDEIRLGQRSIAWGVTHGRSADARQRVFARIIEAAHAAHDTSAFTDEVIEAVYADEERIDRATK